jgi:hypothetical protein
METDAAFVLPTAMWHAMKSALQTGTDRLSPSDEVRRKKFGVVVSLRLCDGSVKERVEVDWDGGVRAEWYAEEGLRAETYGPPRFTAEDIESWGYYERVRQPSWRHLFKKVKVWKVRVWADGRVGELTAS